MKNQQKKILTILFLILILSITSVSIKYDILSIKTVEATNILDTLNNMDANNPIKLLVNNQIRQIEEERNIKLLEEKRAALKVQRIQEDKERIEEEIKELEKDPNS